MIHERNGSNLFQNHIQININHTQRSSLKQKRRNIDTDQNDDKVIFYRTGGSLPPQKTTQQKNAVNSQPPKDNKVIENKPPPFTCLEEAKIHFKKSNTALSAYNKRRNEKTIATLEEYQKRKASYCEIAIKKEEGKESTEARPKSSGVNANHNSQPINKRISEQMTRVTQNPNALMNSNKLYTNIMKRRVLLKENEIPADIEKVNKDQVESELSPS